MIYTVTFNPAVDYVIHTDKISDGCVNRTRSEEIFFGGKGINVSFVLKELGLSSAAMGFTAGFTGEAIENGVSAAGIKTDFVRLPCGFSRINVKIKSDTETEINGSGPVIDADSCSKFFKKLDDIGSGDVLVLAGSVPKSLPADIYEKILAAVSGRQIKAVVDAEKDLLVNVLKYKPFLVKPNNFELADIFRTDALDTPEKVIPYARELRDMGAENVLISMAEKGAVLVDSKGDSHFRPACRGKAVNSVGAGDSMVAGFIAGYLRGGAEEALRLGTAAGGATAFSAGLARRKDIDELLSRMD